MQEKRSRKEQRRDRQQHYEEFCFLLNCIVPHLFQDLIQPFKSLRGCTITQNSDDWVMILGKTTTLNGISQLRLGYFAAYTNKAFYMDYIAIGTY